MENQVNEKIRTIYEYLCDYSEEEINKVISSLNDKDLELIHLRYGEDLKHPVTSDSFDLRKSYIFYNLLIPRMRRRLEGLRKNGGVIEIKDTSRVNNIYECLSEYSKEDVDKVIESLDENDKLLLHIRYGNDFSSNKLHTSWRSRFNGPFYNGLIPKMKRRLERMKNGKDMFTNKDKRFVQNIYECLKGYTEDEVDAVIETLSKEDMDVLHIRYGEDLRSNTLSENWHSKYNYDFYNKLIPKMKRRLEKMRIQKVNSEGLDFSKKIESSNSESFDFLKESELKNNFSLLEPYKAFIIGLRFGYVDGKCYSVEEISEKLKISPKTVIRNIRDGLITYRNLVSKNVEDEIESMNGEVMKLNLKKESSN